MYIFRKKLLPLLSIEMGYFFFATIFSYQSGRGEMLERCTHTTKQLRAKGVLFAHLLSVAKNSAL